MLHVIYAVGRVSTVAKRAVLLLSRLPSNYDVCCGEHVTNTSDSRYARQAKVFVREVGVYR